MFVTQGSRIRFWLGVAGSEDLVFLRFRANPKGPSTQLSYNLKNSNLHNYYPKPEYLIIGSFGPLG